MSIVRSVSGEKIEVSRVFIESEERGINTKDMCPACGSKGHMVMKVTVSNHVDSRYWKLLGSEWFWFCPNPDCSVVYYNNTLSIYFLKGEVKTRVFHKEKAMDRPVCYCLSVTEDTIRSEIFVKKCCDSLDDIQRFTKAGAGRWCPITNPSGKCCREYLEKLVRDLLAEKVPGEVEQRLKELGESFGLEIPRELPEGRVLVLVEGMTCEGCAVAVRSALENTGINVTRVDYRSGLTEIVEPAPSDERIREVVEGVGYRVARIVRKGGRRSGS